MHATRPTTNSCVRNTLREAFTMLEMLAVVLVLSVLFGFLLSAITTLRRSAELKQARTDAVAIAQALKEYRGIFGTWPAQRQGNRDRVYAAANGEDCPTNVIAALIDNPRGLRLLVLPDGDIANLWYRDPWDQPYMIVMDEDGDGRLDFALPERGAISVLNETAGVITESPNGQLILSWELQKPQ